MKFLVVLFAYFFAFVSAGQSCQDQQAVKAVVRLFQQDFNDGRFAQAATYTTPEWEHINPNGRLTKGRAAVLTEVRAVHQSFLKGVTMRLDSLRVRFLSPTVALADVVNGLDPYTTPMVGGMSTSNSAKRMC